MRFTVQHTTTYRYTHAVRLAPHLIRLRPRADAGVRLDAFTLDIAPIPVGRTELLDHEGNVVTQAWFEGETTQLVVTSRVTLETLRRNAFDWLASGAEAPLYPAPLAQRLAPYLQAAPAGAALTAYAAAIRERASSFPLGFLAELNRTLFRSFVREIREVGTPQAPLETLARGRGACRDLAVLFMALCRQVGIAARFVSGYQRGDPARTLRYLHAWPEVYLPDGGWRGFDPTHDLAVADTHVALAAAADPADTAPIAGSFFGTAQAAMHAHIEIDVQP
jgi:transglutaminase-like putative cysteine protease